MKTPVVFQTEGQCDVSITQTGKDSYTVKYGLQTKRKLNQDEAARELGYCLMHALECAGKIART